MEDESGDQFVAYFLPSDETLRKRKREDDDMLAMPEEDEYVLSEIRNHYIQLKSFFRK